MAEEPPINVWNEIRVSGDGIGITLYSETAGDTPVVEDETFFTFDELQSEQVGEILSLRLSDETRERMPASMDEILNDAEALIEEMEEPTLPMAGDPLVDDNAPSWSEDDRVVVEETLSEVNASEYVIQGPSLDSDESGITLDESLQAWGDKTVADANPSYSSDEPVVLARYVDKPDTVYAFPASRLVEPSPEHFPYPQSVPSTR